MLRQLPPESCGTHYDTQLIFSIQRVSERNVKELWNINALALRVPAYLVRELQQLEGVTEIEQDYRIKTLCHI